MPFKKARHRHSVLVVALHTKLKGLQAAKQQPSTMAIDNSAEDAQGLPNRLDELG